MTISSRTAATALASLLIFASPALAQTSTPAPATKSDSMAPAAAPTSEGASSMMRNGKPRSPESVECYKQADEKGLKGKERKKFHRTCVKEAKAKK